MEYEWDDAKFESNLAKHGLSFDAIHDFMWDYAQGPELQHVEGEEREFWVAPLGIDLVAVVITQRDTAMRVISLRIATKPEARRWRKEFQDG